MWRPAQTAGSGCWPSGVENVGAKLRLTVPAGVVGGVLVAGLPVKRVEDPNSAVSERVRVGQEDFPNRRRRAVRIDRQRSEQVRRRCCCWCPKPAGGIRPVQPSRSRSDTRPASSVLSSPTGNRGND